MTEKDKKMSALDILRASQETLDEAKKKSSEESSKRATYLRFNKDGKYSVRILPLAPVIDKDGVPQPLERKGYEYPLRSLMLKIENPNKLDKKGKPTLIYVTVCNVKYAFPDLPSDLIDVYVKTACDLYADDDKLCKKLRGNSYSGGLRWDSKRCMYVYDLENKSNGIQILQLSYSQYKELEERKIDLWEKLNKKSKEGKVACPISSVDNAYPVNINRKTEEKTNYTFNIDTVEDVQPMTEEEVNVLLTTPRLPEVLYRYTKRSLEATIVYLKQMDEKYDIDVMSDPAIQECIDQIKLKLPASDTSSFKFDDGKDGDEALSKEDELQMLYDRFDKLGEEGLDDESEEGQTLRADIREFIEKYELDIKITRKKDNNDLLDEIDAQMSGNGNDDEDDEEEKPVTNKKQSEPEDDEEDDSPATEPSDDEENDDDDDEEEKPRRRERNEDTNEPAARPQRRAARPQRRR